MYRGGPSFHQGIDRPPVILIFYLLYLCLYNISSYIIVVSIVEGVSAFLLIPAYPNSDMPLLAPPRFWSPAVSYLSAFRQPPFRRRNDVLHNIFCNRNTDRVVPPSIRQAVPAIQVRETGVRTIPEVPACTSSPCGCCPTFISISYFISCAKPYEGNPPLASQFTPCRASD